MAAKKKKTSARKGAAKKSSTKKAAKKSTVTKAGRKKATKKKYGAKAQKKVGRALHEAKHGTLKAGRSGRKVKSRKQAIAIGLSEARAAGGKVPPKKKKKSARKVSKR